METRVLTGENKIARFHEELRQLDQMHRGKIAKKTLESRKKMKPFCTGCAIKQLVEQIEKIRKDVEKGTEEGKSSEIRMDINIDYGICETSELTYLGKDEVREKRITADGKTAMVKVGEHAMYKCKNGHRIGMDIMDYEREEQSRGREGKTVEKDSQGSSKK